MPGGIFLVGANANPASAQRPLNLDFERSSVSYSDRPWGWTLGWSAFAGGPRRDFRARQRGGPPRTTQLGHLDTGLRGWRALSVDRASDPVAYDYGFELDAVLPLEFDGIIFIDRTSPSQLLR